MKEEVIDGWLAGVWLDFTYKLYLIWNSQQIANKKTFFAFVSTHQIMLKYFVCIVCLEKPTVWIRMKRSFHGMAPSMNYRTEKPAPAPRPDRLKKESTNSNIMLTNQRKESHDVGTASPRKQSNDFGTLNARKYSHDVGLASPRKYSYDIGTTRKQSNDFGTLNARKYSHDVGSASPRKQSCDTGTISSRTSSSNSLEINQNNPRKHSSTSQDPMLDDSDQTQQKPQPQPRKKKYSDVAQRLPEIKEQKPKLKPVESTNQNIYSSLDETYKAESIYQEIGHNVTNPPGNNSGNFDTAKSHLGPPSNEAATTTYATPPVSRHQVIIDLYHIFIDCLCILRLVKVLGMRF